MNKLYNYYYAAKAWWAGVTVAVTALAETVYAAIEDDAISLTEVEGAIMAGIGLLGALAAFKLVWQVRNEGMRPPVDPHITSQGG